MERHVLLGTLAALPITVTGCRSAAGASDLIICRTISSRPLIHFHITIMR